jgi:uncharacterized protein (DUF1697 family)
MAGKGRTGERLRWTRKSSLKNTGEGLAVPKMRRESKPTVFVALLRAINVGGKNMIRMSLLKASFERIGFEDVTTYINSGNIIFKTKEGDARKLERKIEKMLSKEYKLECKVVVRSFSELANLVKHLPKNWNDDERWRYNVMYLRHSIDSENVLHLLEPKSDIEQVVYCPGALLWSVRVSDVTRTSLVKLPGRKIFQEMTVRNLNTTKKLYELMKKMCEA